MTPIAHSRPAGVRALRVLLAEDNATNQKLAVCLLEKQGHSVTVANDGQQALDAARGGTFDLILMDVQMPVLDGLEATAAIRDYQCTTGVRVPIVAVTANALIGDRERCLKAGMDDYVTKPLNSEILFKIIHRLVSPQPPSETPTGRAAVPGAGSVSAPASSAAPAFDPAASLAQIGDDVSLLDQLVVVFLEQLPRLLPPLADAVRQRDAKGIRQTAHALCSSISVLAATPAKDAARQLELMGLNNQVAGLEEAHARVLTEITRLQGCLGQWRERQAA